MAAPVDLRRLARARAVRDSGFRAALPIHVLLVAASLPGLSAAATINVPGNQPTLKAAVAAAASGDVILLAPGAHQGGVYIDGKVLTIASRYLTTGDTSYIATTAIDSIYGDVCGGNSTCRGDAVVEFGPNSNGSAMVGLTVTNARCNCKGVRSASRVDLTKCHIIRTGDGVNWTSGGDGTFRDCLFANNDDDGIDLNDRVALLVTNCVIRDNRDDGVEFRTRAASGPATTVTFTGNRITGNGEDGYQIIDSPDSASVIQRLEHNIFSRNAFAAVAVDSNSNTLEDYFGSPSKERVYLIGNTFVGENYGMVGGANVIALNNVFTGIAHAALRRVGGNSIASYNLFWNNVLNYESSVVDAPHLTIADPRLAANELLTPGSPAIDTGTAFFQWHGETVLNLPSSAYAGPAPDLGAFEYATPPPPTSSAPMVDAGANQAVMLPAFAQLNGTVSDDGLPIPPGGLVTSWSLASGPSPVAFQDFRVVDTHASFTSAGTYVLRLSASDGESNVADSVTVTVNGAPPGAALVERRIEAGDDDGEEQPSGTVYLTSSDIEIVTDSGVVQIDGLRFTNLSIPQGSVIANAFVQFESKEAQSDPTALTIQGQDADNAAAFSGAANTFDISTRPRTSAMVSWSPAPWINLNESGPLEQTPDLSAVIQEIVDRPGWHSGNAMVIVITGTGHRTAYAYNGKSSGAALLHVEYHDATTSVPIGTDGMGLRVVGPFAEARRFDVELSLSDDSPASLDLFDVAGRRLESHTLAGAGLHRVRLEGARQAGVFFVRLVQGSRARLAKAVVLR